MMQIKVIVLACAMGMLVLSAQRTEATLVTGSLASPDCLNIAGSLPGGVQISWEIESQTDGSWFYQYWITDLTGDHLESVSHLTLEVSPNVTGQDFWGFDGDWEFGAGTDSTDIYTDMANFLKLDYSGEDVTVWSFYSTRAPVPGDVFIKNGYWNAYNAEGCSVMRPDTFDVIVPEPATLSLIGLGLAGAGLMKRRKAKG